jgi:uncharacterized protein (DUF1778 family)
MSTTTDETTAFMEWLRSRACPIDWTSGGGARSNDAAEAIAPAPTIVEPATAAPTGAEAPPTVAASATRAAATTGRAEASATAQQRARRQDSQLCHTTPSVDRDTVASAETRRRSAKQPRTVLSVRVSPDERDTIGQAAARCDMDESVFVRAVALAAAAEAPLMSPQDAELIRALVTDLRLATNVLGPLVSALCYSARLSSAPVEPTMRALESALVAHRERVAALEAGLVPLHDAAKRLRAAVRRLR